MSFESFSDFLAMGGHGLYVWIAYGIFALVFASNLIAPIYKRKDIIVKQAQRLKRERAES